MRVGFAASVESVPNKGGGDQGRRLLPERIGRYDILGELGVGGMAVVYLARAEGIGSFERLVAVKRMHEHLCRDDSFVQMFLDEARVAARLHHPNVVAVHEVAEDQGRYYLVMEYVRGEPLSFVLNKAWRGPSAEPFPPVIGALLFSEIADAIDSAHELRDLEGRSLEVVHRDISTRNLLLGYDGLLRLLDFGVVKTQDQTHKTKTGSQKGTVAYMAPEQILGRPLDRRVDIFSLGVVLWETTVGKRLFQAESEFATAARVRQAAVPRPSSVRSGYPPVLERIVLKALARDPAERYQTARALRDALTEYLSSEPAVLPQHARDYLTRIAPGRLEEKIEAERGALFQNSRRIALPRYASEEVDLESSAGLPEFTMPESARKTAQSDPRDETASQFATERAPGPETSFDDESLSTFDGNTGSADASTLQNPRREEETVREGATRSTPGVRGLPPPSSNLRIIPSTSAQDHSAIRSDFPPAPSRSRLVSGLSLEHSTMASGPVELRPEDLLELSGSLPPVSLPPEGRPSDFPPADAAPTGRSPPPAPAASFDEPWARDSDPPAGLEHLEDDLDEHSTADSRVRPLSDLRSTYEQNLISRTPSRSESAILPQGRSSTRRWLIAGGLLIVASIVAGAALEVYVLSSRRAAARSEETPPEPAPLPSPRVRLEAVSASVAETKSGAAGLAGDTTATASAEAPSPPPAPPSPAGPRAIVDPEIEIRLSGLPPGAKIDGALAGPGGVIRVPRAQETTLKLTAPGYRPQELKVSPDGPRAITVKMRRGRR